MAISGHSRSLPSASAGISIFTLPSGKYSRATTSIPWKNFAVSSQRPRSTTGKPPGHTTTDHQRNAIMEINDDEFNNSSDFKDDFFNDPQQFNDNVFGKQIIGGDDM